MARVVIASPADADTAAILDDLASKAGVKTAGPDGFRPLRYGLQQLPAAAGANSFHRAASQQPNPNGPRYTVSAWGTPLRPRNALLQQNFHRYGAPMRLSLREMRVRP